MGDEKKCFAWWDSATGWSCAALRVHQCEYPNCRTYKTEEEVIEQKKACLERINSLPPDKKYDIWMKYGEYKIEK